MSQLSPFPADCARAYESRRLIGSGGFGDVWLATQASLDRQVAIKLLHGAAATNPNQILRFQNEARITAALAHPNIVVILDHGCAKGIPWIAYEFVEGTSVRRLLEAGPLPWQQAFQIGAQVASALEAAHTIEVLHRDIKPDNLLIDRVGHVKVSDFGISRWREISTQLTEPGTLIGSPAYLSPLQIQGEVATAQSDIYALGVTLFEMVTGTVPYSDPSPAEVLSQHLRRRVPNPSDLVQGLPGIVDAIITRCLAKDASARFSDARSLREALDGTRVLREEGSTTQPDPMSRTVVGKHVGYQHDTARMAVPKATPVARSSWFWTIPLAAALGLTATLLTKHFHTVTLPPPAPTPTASSAGDPRERAGGYHSQRWRKYQELLAKLESPDVPRARGAVQAILSSSPVFLPVNFPRMWADWIRLGRWLDDPARPAAPPRMSCQSARLDDYDLRMLARKTATWSIMDTDARVDDGYRVVIQFPADGICWLYLGNALDREGRSEAARLCYKVGIRQLKPGRWPKTNALLWHLLIAAYLQAANAQLEAAWIERMTDTAAQPLAWHQLEAALVTDVPRFARIAEPWLDDPAQGASAAGALGYAFARAGRSRQAVEVWDNARKRHPTNPELPSYLVSFYLSRGDLPMAVRYMPGLAANHPYPLDLNYLRLEDHRIPEGPIENKFKLFWLLENGQWSTVEQLVANPEWYSAHMNYPIEAPLTELYGHGSTCKQVPQSLEAFKVANGGILKSDFWDQLAGACSDPKSQNAFEQMYTAAGAAAWMGPFRALWLSRRGRHREALEQLVQTQARWKDFLGQELRLEPRIVEVLMRSAIAQTQDAEISRLLHHFDWFCAKPTGQVWADFCAGRYAHAAERAMSHFDELPHFGWLICATWSAWKASDFTQIRELKRRAHIRARAEGIGLWILRELKKIPDR